MIRGPFAILLVLVAGSAVFAEPPAQAGSQAGQTCAGLRTLVLPETTIQTAEEVSAPSFHPPGSGPLADLPPFCRVVGVSTPAIRFEVWLPLTTWNGKFQGVGNGGMAGVISYGAMAEALRRGYATASTDTGHVSADLFDTKWALRRPDLIADFGYRGIHVMTQHAKRAAGTFYGVAPSRSYFVGCSKGGGQAFMEAQRFPEDYDGIIAGAPAYNWTRFYAGGHLGVTMATERDPESYVPASKVPLIANAVNNACDANDGVKDDVLENPRACKVDLSALACRPGQDTASCLTAKQVSAVENLWAGARTRSGQTVLPGLVPGGESGGSGWSRWITGTGPGTSLHARGAVSFFRDFIFERADWDIRSFEYDRDLPFALAKVGHLLDAVNPDLRPFQQRGGKLLVYHGWSDADVSPLNTLDYYDSVTSLYGAGGDATRAAQSVSDFFRLFMAPGVHHCNGGPGPDTFDMLTALENWVEKGLPPDRIIASKVVKDKVERTRPLCAYPAVAVYSGSGSTDEATNFRCELPRPSGQRSLRGHPARRSRLRA